MDEQPPILPAHIEQTVQAIAELQARHNRRATPIQRIVSRSVAFVGRPKFVGILTLIIVVWMVANAVLGFYHLPFDPAPYPLLVDLGEGLGLYITVLILISQRRDDELTSYREQLTLELAILSEQKSAKLIQLIEELRRDNPLIHDRVDEEAEALSIPADPQTVLDAIMESQEGLDAAGDEPLQILPSDQEGVADLSSSDDGTAR